MYGTYPIVSILLPFKNTGSFIGQCIDSILAQTHSDWELIAVDDKSSDGSRQLMLDYALKDQRIKVVPNYGEGIIPALRTAFSLSSGELITRMDSDDIMEPVKLETMVKSLLATGSGHIALGKVRYFSEHGMSDGYLRYERWINQLTLHGSNFTHLYRECVIPSPCFMVYRKDLEDCGGFHENRYPEDYDLTFRFYEHGLKCIPSNIYLHLWRDYPERTSRNSEHYAANFFMDIKIHYFLKLHRNIKRELVIWGAGWKGKKIARELQSRKIPFRWICNNPKKTGTRIYDITLEEISILGILDCPQSIITVANPESQTEIRSYFEQNQAREMIDFFFFC